MSGADKKYFFELKDAETVYAWIEQESSIHLKSVTKHGDPVELTADEARELGQVLIRLADKLEEMDQ